MQAAQVAHAAFQFSYEHRPLAAQWLQESNFVIVLSVEDEIELEALGRRAEDENLPVTWFREPDIENQLTAIAIAPSPVTVELTAELPLALREYVKGPPDGDTFAYTILRASEDRVIIEISGLRTHTLK